MYNEFVLLASVSLCSLSSVVEKTKKHPVSDIYHTYSKTNLHAMQRYLLEMKTRNENKFCSDVIYSHEHLPA